MSGKRSTESRFWSGAESLDEAKEYLREEWLDEGDNCPVCGRFVKLQPHTINKSHVHVLARIWAAYGYQAFQSSAAIFQITRYDRAFSKSARLPIGLLLQLGLIEHVPGVDAVDILRANQDFYRAFYWDDDKSATDLAVKNLLMGQAICAWYRFTEEGANWVNGYTPSLTRGWFFDNKFIELETRRVKKWTKLSTEVTTIFDLDTHLSTTWMGTHYPHGGLFT